MKRILKTAALGTALAFGLVAPALAGEATTVDDVREKAARQISSMVNDPAFDAAVREQLSKGSASLANVLQAYGSGNMARAGDDDTRQLRDLERQAIRLRGLEGRVDSLINLRVLGAKDGTSPDMAALWTATTTHDPVSGEKQIVAYDPTGGTHRYALDALPDVPMLLVETNTPESMRAGITMVNEALRAMGLQGSSNRSRSRAVVDEDITRLAAIQLANDKEPNGLFDAEVYAIINGIGADGKAYAEVVNMPYLDHDKRWYAPGQDMVRWRELDSNFVAINFFEKDDTEFKTIISAIAGAVGDLAAFGGPEALPITVVSKMAQSIVDAMPASWYRNDDDYIDSVFVIEKGRAYGTKEKPLVGAGSNASMVLEPYVVKGG